MIHKADSLLTMAHHTLSGRLPVAEMTWASVTLMGSSFAVFSTRLPTVVTLRTGRPACQAQDLSATWPMSGNAANFYNHVVVL